MSAVPFTIQRSPRGRERGRRRLRRQAVVMAALVLVSVGCEQRVIRRKEYYPGQFSRVTSADVPTAAADPKPQTDFIQDAWHGFTGLFDKNSKSNVNYMTNEELRELQAKRDRENGVAPPQTPESNPPANSPANPPVNE